MDTLARHWDFAALVETLVASDAGWAAPAVRAAAEQASDEVLARVLAATGGMRGGALARAVETALKERPGVPYVPGPIFPQLTKREHQILRLMAEGRRNQEIATGLFLSPATVKTHINHILSKLGVNTRVEAILMFKEAQARAGVAP